jgi:hypothetical protein
MREESGVNALDGCQLKNAQSTFSVYNCIHRLHIPAEDEKTAGRLNPAAGRGGKKGGVCFPLRPSSDVDSKGRRKSESGRTRAAGRYSANHPRPVNLLEA